MTRHFFYQTFIPVCIQTNINFNNISLLYIEHFVNIIELSIIIRKIEIELY